MYEVEQKFPVDDLAAIEAKLTALGAESLEPVTQIDTYYAHPVRDFSQTDEALRIRTIGDENRITYKGPKLDLTTKTRREIELPLAPGPASAAQYQALLEALGFRPVFQVKKRRRPLTLSWQGQSVEGALDEVDGLGTFVELELSADDSQLAAAQAALTTLATHLQLTRTERRSYLELLLERQTEE